ncbi:uncharacterized protein LOC143561823 [Bidens hawaiensis]|uniref:uncharacterized protein LOC143561823 n=1 Tax=Bidens hawaiensis TaxID=980011 RepID=UPI00404A92FE
MMFERTEEEEHEIIRKLEALEARLDKLIEIYRLRKLEELEARLEELSARYQIESPSYKEQQAVYEDDEGVIEEMELKPVDYTDLSEDAVEEPLNQMEDDEEEEHAPSWEDDFGEELVALPVYEEDGEFDPVGDLIYLETLIMGKPTMEIKRAPNRKEELVANEEDQNMMVVESPHHMKFSRYVKELDSGSPPKLKNPKKSVRKCLDQYVLRVQRWYIKSYGTTLKCKTNHFPHYMPPIRFGPGKFKYWWSYPFECFRLHFSFTMCYVIIYVGRVELNRLDRGWIKEKPPD